MNIVINPDSVIVEFDLVAFDMIGAGELRQKFRSVRQLPNDGSSNQVRMLREAMYEAMEMLVRQVEDGSIYVVNMNILPHRPQGLYKLSKEWHIEDTNWPISGV